MSAVLAYIGLGSNLDDPLRQLRSALDEIGRLTQTRLIRTSSFYRTPPWGVLDQADFINAVAEVETTLSPRVLLEDLLNIEQRAGRTRGGKQWGPRRIDLDLLVYGQRQIAEDDLRIPHPRMHTRAFVLVPLAELESSLQLPGQGCVVDHIADVDARSCVRIVDAEI